MKAACGKPARAVWAADGGQRLTARLLRPDNSVTSASPGGNREKRGQSAAKEVTSATVRPLVRGINQNVTFKKDSLLAILACIIFCSYKVTRLTSCASDYFERSAHSPEHPTIVHLAWFCFLSRVPQVILGTTPQVLATLIGECCQITQISFLM